MNRIDAIIWDVGGVLIDEVPVSQDVRSRLELDETTFRPLWNELISQYGTGSIAEAAIWSAFEAEGAIPVKVSENILGNALHERLKPHWKVISLTEQLDVMGYEQAVLSNTIPNHAKVLRQWGIYETFPQDQVFLSHEIGFRKPDIRAFTCVLKALGIEPSHTLFVDDSRDCLTVAAGLGMVTLQAESDEDAIVRAVTNRLF